MRGQSKTKEQLKNELNKPRHRIIEQDRSEDKRKQIEDALRASENYSRTLVENLPQKIFLKDKNSVYLSCNENYSRDLKIRAGEITGKTDYDFYPKELAEKYQADDRRIMESGKTEDIEERYIQDGKEVIVHTVKTPIRDEKGKIIGILGIFWDITKRKHAEYDLREYREQLQEMVEKRTAELRMVNEQLQEEITEHRRTEEVLREYQRAIEGSQDIIAVVDQNYNYLLVNNAFLKYRGMDREQVIGQSVPGVLGKDVFERVVKKHLDTCFQGEVVHYEMKYTYPEFGERDLLVSYFPIEGPGGVNRVASVIHDITEYKRSEQVLRESEERHRLLVENADETIFVAQDGMLKFVNRKATEITGYSKEELTSKPFVEFIHPDDREMVLDRHLKRFQGKELPSAYPFRIISKDGNVRWVELNIVLISWEGRPATLTFLADITDHKRAEEALRQSEEKYRTILENIEDGYYEVDIAGNFTFLNDSICRIWGYPKEELVGMNNRQYTDQENARKLFQAFNEVYRTGEPAKGFDWEIIRKDGAKRYIEASVSLQKDSSGKPIGFRGIIRDITERRRAEEALRQSEEKFRQLFDEAPVGYHEYDLQGRITGVNRTELDMLGYSRDEMVGKPVWNFIAGEDSQQAVLAKIAGVITPGRQFERTYRRKDGTTFPVLIEDRILRDPKGKIIGMRSTIQDITERRRAEEVLRESEQKYRTILENIEDGYYEVDIAGNFTFFNDSLCRMLGYSRDELLGMNNRQYMDQEGANRLYRTFNRVHRTGEPAKALDHEIIRKDETKRFAEASVTLMKDSAGQACGFRGITRDITERKRTEEVLKESEKRYRTVIEHSNDGVSIVKGDTHLYANQKFLEMFGYNHPEEVIGKPILITVHPDDRDRVMENTLRRQRGEDAPSKYEFKGIRKDGSIIYVEVSATRIAYFGEVVSLVNLRDITERRRLEQEKAALEEQLRQSQKIEAMGRLAGGVAHDFNNLLTVITGYSDSILSQLQPHDLMRGEALEIKVAAEKAASLTRQLLAFSRKQMLQPKVLNLNDLITNMDKMFRRLIGEEIYLSNNLAEDLGKVKADPGQIEQVLMNLVVNARDAMPSGGKLTIATANVELDEYYAQAHTGVTPDHYSMISISDTGIAMSPEVRERIFEPFFTTKEEGKGTGLGLSTVYGIVKQSGGNIWVYSEPGKGTTFKIYLPRTEEDVKLVKPKVITTQPVQGSETILLVEDEETLRRFARLLLQRNGYRLLEASNGKEALRIVQEQRDKPIHLLMTDVVMPGMSGRELGDSLESLRPEMKVLYMSGYTEDAVVQHGVMEEQMNFIQKPFTGEELTRKVREVLDK